MAFPYYISRLETSSEDRCLILTIKAHVVSVSLQIGDIIIPAKTTIVIPVGAMQRDPKVWGPDAASFVPERFLRQTPARSSGEAEGKTLPRNRAFSIRFFSGVEKASGTSDGLLF